MRRPFECSCVGDVVGGERTRCQSVKYLLKGLIIHVWRLFPDLALVLHNSSRGYSRHRVGRPRGGACRCLFAVLLPIELGVPLLRGRLQEPLHCVRALVALASLADAHQLLLLNAIELHLPVLGLRLEPQVVVDLAPAAREGRKVEVEVCVCARTYARPSECVLACVCVCANARVVVPSVVAPYVDEPNLYDEDGPGWGTARCDKRHHHALHLDATGSVLGKRCTRLCADRAGKPYLLDAEDERRLLAHGHRRYSLVPRLAHERPTIAHHVEHRHRAIRVELLPVGPAHPTVGLHDRTLLDRWTAPTARTQLDLSARTPGDAEVGCKAKRVALRTREVSERAAARVTAHPSGAFSLARLEVVGRTDREADVLVPLPVHLPTGAGDESSTSDR
eukprot:scaffold19505_cov33-Tisochrysis_lutea.AAC.3